MFSSLLFNFRIYCTYFANITRDDIVTWQYVNYTIIIFINIISQVFLYQCASARWCGWRFISFYRDDSSYLKDSQRYVSRFFHKLRLIVHTKSVRQHVVLRDVPISTTGCRTTSTLRNGIATDIVRRVSQSDLWQPVIVSPGVGGAIRICLGFDGRWHDDSLMLV